VPLWASQPGPQTDAITADWCPELFYGGAAGGGKSDFLLGDFLQDVPTYESAWRGVLFRRTYPELEELIARSHELYPQTGGTWHEQQKRWKWSNGATLRLRFLEREIDALRYQGHQYTWQGWDELTQWASAFAYKYLRGRLRSAHGVPTKRIRSAGNPGGVGHHWVKAMFIDPAPGGYVPILDPDTGMERMFIPSKLRDNAVLVQSDPGYAGRLKGVGSPELVKALLEGDWSVISGAFFPEWHAAKHIIAPFEIPAHWLRYGAIDWGSAKPFCVLWLAVSDGTLPQFPRGALIVYREWYGSTGEPNVGIRMVAEDVGKGIAERTRPDPKHEGAAPWFVADPAMFTADGGPSIAERVGKASKLALRRADNARVSRNGAMGGWDQVRARLQGEEGRPMLYVFSTCPHLIRTLPALQHDADRPEDVDTDGEDHAPDTLRYGCMARPYVRTENVPPAPEWLTRGTDRGINVNIRAIMDRQFARRRAEED